jgi:excisionase family DNA binding protein
VNAAAKSIISLVIRNDDGTWWITVNPETPITTTISNLCRLTGCGRSKTYELLAEGTLESIKIGKRRLIVLDSYRQLMERQRVTEATARIKESRGPALQPIDPAAKTTGRCGEPQAANSGDLDRPVQEISAGILRQPRKPDEPDPPPPWAEKAAPTESKPYQTRNKNAEKSSARRDANKGVA